MKANVIAIVALASALLLPLSACSQPDRDNTQSGAANDAPQAAKEVQEQTSSSFIGAEVRKGIEQAKKEMVTQNIDVGGVHFTRSESSGINNVRIVRTYGDDGTSLPKAQITPQGDLLIAGKPVQATPEQHAMLLDYRMQIIGVIDAGMDIGASGADIGVAAAKQAILGAFTGKSDKEIEASIKPQTAKIQAAAMQLCKRMPDLLASQQKLPAAMPAFKPYATMRQKDVDDCGKDIANQNGKKGFAVFSD